MTDDPSPQPLDIYTSHDENGDDELIGHAELCSDGSLILRAGRKAHVRRVAAALNAINAKEGVHIDVAPPPGAPRFAVASRLVTRDSDDYLDAVIEHLQRYHGLVVERARRDPS